MSSFNMAMALDVLADVRKYQTEISKLPNITQREAAKAALRMEKELTKGQVKAANEAEKAAKKSAKVWDKSATSIGKDLKKLGRAAATANPAIGNAVTAAGNLAVAASAMVSPVGLAVAAFVATTLVAGAAAFAIGGAAVALGYAAFKADEALHSLRGFKEIDSSFYPSVDEDTLRSLERLDVSLDAVKAIVDSVIVAVGSNIGPAFEKGASAAVGLALHAGRLFEGFIEGKSLIEEFAVTTTAALIEAFTSPLEPLGRMAAGILALDDAVGLLPDSARESLGVFKSLADGRMAEGLSRIAVATVSQAFATTDLATALGKAEAEGRAFIATTMDAVAAIESEDERSRAAAKSAREMEKAERAAAKAAAEWARQLDVLRRGGDLVELEERLQAIAEAERIGALDSQAAGELRVEAHRNYADAVSSAEAQVQQELDASARAEIARLSEVERARRNALSSFERGIEDAAAALQDAGWGEQFSALAASAEANFSRAAAAVAPYLDAINLIASENLSTHTEALEELTGQIEAIDELLADLTETQLDAADLSGEALVEAYRDGAVAAEDLSESQKAAIETALEAEKAALAERAQLEKAAAMQAWEVQQATAIAGTIAAGAQALVAAFALGPVAGAAAAGGIALLTATQLGVIGNASPEFQHQGGYKYPDEYDTGGIRKLHGEGTLNRSTTDRLGGPQAVDALNSGGSLAPSVSLRIGRLEAAEIVRTDIRAGGQIARTARAEARRSGRSGASGRRALA